MGGKTALGLDNNIGALVCYVGNILCGLGGLIYSIIVVVQDKNNKLPRFHAFQSILLSVTGAIIWVVLGLPTYFLIFMGALGNSTIFSLLGMLMGLVLLVVFLAILFFWVMSVVKAYGGEIYKIPVIGNMAEKWA